MRLPMTIVLFFTLAACDDTEAGIAEGPVVAREATREVPPAALEGLPAEQAEEPPGPVVEEGAFELRAQSESEYSVGTDAAFDIALTTRAGWHVNEEYPITVELESPQAVEIEKHELTKEDAAEFGDESARFHVAFNAAEAGEHRIQAKVDFAVCTPETCVPEERTLSFVLPVAAGTP